MVGNFEVDVEHQQRIGHLFGPLPPEMKDDTAFMDRLHSYVPGWDFPKIAKELLTDRVILARLHEMIYFWCYRQLWPAYSA